MPASPPNRGDDGADPASTEFDADDGERFGLNLWRSRRRADLSQEGLGNLVGLSRDAIWRLETGQRLPRLDTIARLAAGTNVSTCALLEGLEWRPGHYVDGDFYVEHPGAALRRGGSRA